MLSAQGPIERSSASLEAPPAQGSTLRSRLNPFARALLLTVLALSPAVLVAQAPALDTAQRCREMLQQATQDKNPDIRKAAVEALSLIGSTDSLHQALTAMVEDQDVLVRTSVVNTLGDLKSRSSIPILRKALDDPVPEVSLAAARALYGLHDPDGIRFLLAVASGQSKASSSYLTQRERNALRLFHTPAKLFTTAAISVVGFVPLPGLGIAASSAQGITSEPDSSARAAALLLIGSDRDPALASAVESALSDKEWSVRAAAIHVAATHPYPALRDSLVVLLDDKKPAVRFRAAAAYIRLSSKPQPTEHKPNSSH
jgi:HEAT repeat protein